MKRIFGIVCSVAILFSCCGSAHASGVTVTEQAEKVYEESVVFEDDLKTNGETVTVGESFWKDIRVSLKLSPGKAANAGILLRYKDENEHLELRFYRNGNVFLLQKKNSIWYSKLAQASISDYSGTHSVEAEMLGKSIAVTIDGKVCLKSKRVAVDSGCAGIVSAGGFISADDVRISLLSEKDRVNYTQYGMVDHAEDIGMPTSYGALEGETNYQQYLSSRAEIPGHFPMLAPTTPRGTEKELFVSSEGDDSNPGTIDAPVKTIAKGVELLKELKYEKGAALYLRGGNYSVSDTVTLSNIIGSKEYPVFISNYNNEKVVLSGGTVIAPEYYEELSAGELARVPLVSKDFVKKVDLKKLGITIPYENKLTGTETKMIYKAKVPTAVLGVSYGSMNMIPARYPNNDFVRVGEPINPGGHRYNPDTPYPEVKLLDDRPLSWKMTNDMWIYGSIHQEWDINNYQIGEVKKESKSIVFDSYNEWPAEYHGDNRYYYYNIMEEMDLPGEYVIDRTNGVLYFYPVGDNDDTPLTLLTGANTVLNIDNSCKHVVIRGLNFENGKGGAINACGYDISVQGCLFESFTGAALSIEGELSGAAYNKIVNCGNSYTAASVSGGNRWSLTPARNYFQNNIVFDDSDSGVAFAINSAVGCLISHNLFAGAKSHLLSEGWCNEVIVENNSFAYGALVSSDAGAVYVCGSDFIGRGQHVRNNYFQDMSAYGDTKRTNAVYFDDFGQGKYAYNNVAQDGNLYVHGGRDHVMDNNITNGTLVINANYYRGKDDLWKRSMVPYVNAAAGFVHSYMKPYEALWNSRYHDMVRYRELYNKYAEEYKKEGYTREQGNYEDQVRLPANNILLNNIVSSINLDPLVVEYGEKIDGNIDSEMPLDKSITFENGLEDDAEFIASLTPNFKIPDISEMGPVFLEGILDKPVLAPIEAITPTDGGKGQVIYDDVIFKWTPSFGAYYYTIKIATDAEMTNIIEEAIANDSNYIPSNLSDFGNTYYWQVEAHTTLREIEEKSVKSPVFSFTTMTYDEAVQRVPIDKKAFEDDASRLKAELKTIKESGNAGDYAVGTAEKINTLIKAAEEKVKTAKINSTVREAEGDIAKARNILYASTNPVTYNVFDDFGKGRLFFKGERWNTVSSGGLISFAPKEGFTTCIDTSPEKLARNAKITFKMKIEKMANWMGIAFRQSNPAGMFAADGNSYDFIIKYDLIELQKYNGGKSYGIVQSVENNGEFIRPNEMHDYEINVNNVDSGVKIQILIDGKPVIDYLDENSYIADGGHVGLLLNSVNGTVTLSK